MQFRRYTLFIAILMILVFMQESRAATVEYIRRPLFPSAGFASDAYSKAAYLDTTEIDINTSNKMKIAANAIDSTKVAPGSITGSDIKNKSITNLDIKTDAVNSLSVLNYSLQTADYDTGSVTTLSVLDNNLIGADIQNYSLTGVDIDTFAIQGFHLNNNCVDGTTISGHPITGALGVRLIGSSQIINYSLQTVDYDTGSVTSLSVADYSLQTADYDTGSVTTLSVLDGSLTGDDIQNGSLSKDELDFSVLVANQYFKATQFKLDGTNPPTAATHGTAGQSQWDVLNFDANADSTDDIAFLDIGSPRLSGSGNRGSIVIFFIHDDATTDADDVIVWKINPIVCLAGGSETLDQAGTGDITVSTALGASTDGKLFEAIFNEPIDYAVNTLYNLKITCDASACSLAADKKAQLVGVAMKHIY